MKPSPEELKALRKKREAELQRLLFQMKQDNLMRSTVFKNLENELSHLRNLKEDETKESSKSAS